MIIDSNNNFFITTLASIGDGVIATDLSGDIVYINDAAEEIMGWSLDEVKNKNFDEIFILIDINKYQLIKSLIYSVMESGKKMGLSENSALVTKNGEYKYVSASVSPIINESGIISGTVTVFRDITNIRRVELTLKEEQKNFINMFNSAPVGILFINENAIITRVNDEALKFLNNNRDKSIGEKFGDAFFCQESFLTKKGCGHSEKCKSCELKKAAYLALNSGLSTTNIEFSKIFIKNNYKKEFWFKASITPMTNGDKKNAVIVLMDITDRKRKESELQESRDFYLHMFENFPTMIWKTDLEGKYTYVGKQWDKFVGKDKSESLGLGWTRFIHEEDIKSNIKLHEVSIQNRQPYDTEMRILHNSGEYRWVQGINRPFYDINGDFDGFIGIGIDITDRKAAEEELYRYKILSQNVRDVIHFIDMEGNIIDVNQSALALYGYNYEEFLKLNVRDLRAEGLITSEFLEKCDREGMSYETIHYHKDKSTFPVEISVKGADIGGKRVIVSIIRDITERKKAEKALRESEEKFRGIFNNANDGVFLYEINNNFINEKFIEVNKAACNYLGYTKEELFKMSFYDTNAEQCKDKLHLIVETLQRDGKGIFETVHRTKDNKLVPVEMNVYTFNQTGKRIALSIVRDITQRKVVEDSLKAAKEVAEIANKTKSEFLANMSHEIRTPINGIVGMVELTLLTELNSEQKENITIIKSCANSLLNVINDILDFSKMEAGKLVVENISFNIKSLIEDTIKAHSPKAIKKGLAFNYAFSSTIPRYLVGDPNRLQQILNNLIGNAIKFTERGEVWVNVKKIDTQDDDVEIQFSVEDSGIGISEDNIGRLFESFSQLDGSITRRFGGTGLGLAISKQLSEMMGGSLWVDSQESLGSKFHLKLKFKIGTAIKEPTIEVYQPQKIDREYKVLLTEDDKVSQIVIMRILKERGYSVDTASNGLEAIEKCMINSYDIILMDIQMPVMDGIKVTKRIREINKHTPIIAITGYALKGDREKFLSQGMDGYISKPIKIEELFSTIEKYISLGRNYDNFAELDVSFDESGEIVIKPKEVKIFDKKDGHILNELSKTIDSINNEITIGKFHLIESLAHKVKELSNEIGIEELKTIAFKMELDARRGNLEMLVEKGKKVSDIFEVFKKSVL